LKGIIVLGVTGSVAAYRAADFARDLMRAGFVVRVCLTRSAQQFVTPLLFETLTGEPCLVDAFDEPVRGRMAHVDWAREARVIVVAPATANVIANLARGNAEDMLTTLVSASNLPIVIAPAMNPEMYASPANQENLAALKARGVEVVEPVEGDVVSGETGLGKLAPTERILEAVISAAASSAQLRGQRVVVTAGPTYEALDPVRFVGNRSSGKMGYAVARAAARMGAEVTLISGPVSLPAPANINLRRVESAQEMSEAAMAAANGASLFVGAAAVADFRPATVSEQKLKRRGLLELTLEPTPDILGCLHDAYPGLRLIGFAAETGTSEESALEKLSRKGLYAIAMNDVSRSDIGFDSDENEVLVFFADGRREILVKDSKFNIAWRLLDLVCA
jgi:phosphopantothenoylcysteine decarboxylase/phosphopantothenate--cysteine ligase